MSQAAERPGTLSPVSNTILISDPETLRAGNQSVAHEVGHLLGMADWRFPGPEIMCLPHRAHPIRSLTPRVENRLHDSANFNRPGRIGGPIEDLGQLTNPDAR